ncbi:LacI family DNA-binding transcriptional regulator [Muricomes intestini]|uniref:LacI family DNA-binding transcriptional regulator n=1 Tax=Muricomes intestini TaxID=1796634 RepID=UPI002FE0C92D
MAATMKDIAKKTGLGLATISSYLNGGNVREKNRIKIEAAIEELHFEVNEVARGLKTNRTKTIGVILPELNIAFCTQIITEVEDLLRNQGYATIICDCRSDEKREEEAVEFLLHRRVDGLIIMPSGKHGSYLKKFISAGKPVVLIDRELEEIECDCVLVDNESAVKDAVEKLILAGHTRIGIIIGPSDIYTAKRRYTGYCMAMEQAGLAVEERLIVRGDYTIEGGAAAMKKLVNKNPDMTAVFVSNCEMTMGAIIEINELGIKIPEQLSFVGFDNLEFAKANIPKLSIVTQPTKEIAGQVFELLLERLEGTDKQKKSQTVKLKTGFIEGKSVNVSGRKEWSSIY